MQRLQELKDLVWGGGRGSCDLILVQSVAAQNSREDGMVGGEQRRERLVQNGIE